MVVKYDEWGYFVFVGGVVVISESLEDFLDGVCLVR